MIGVLKKNMGVYLGTLVAFLAVDVVFIFLVGNMAEYVLMIANLPLIYVFLYIISIEQYEDKNHGYAILAALPLKPSEVVFTKFFQLLVGIILVTLPSQLIDPAKGGELVRLFPKLTLLSANLAALIGGILYLGIFAFGYMKFARTFVMAILVLGVGLNFVLMTVNSVKAPVNPFETFLGFVRGLDGIFLTVIVLAVYGLIFFASVKVLERKRIT